MAKMLKSILDGYQRRAARFAYKEKKAALFMRPGTGKTITSLAVLARAAKKEGKIRCLIVAPRKPLSQWPRQMKRHLAVDVTIYSKIEALEKARNAKVEGAIGDNTIEVLLLSYGSLDARKEQIRKLGFSFIIYDESHKIKNRKSQASKAAAFISRTAERVLILTGTPRGNIDVDFYAQFRAMDETIFGSWKDFERKYTVTYGFEGRKHKIRPGMEKLFMKKIAKKSFFQDEYEHSDLKPEIEEYIYTKLTGHALKHYKEMEAQFSTVFKKTQVKDDLAATNIYRLQQLCGGFLRVEDDTIQLEQDKLIDLMKVVSRFPKNQKLVIFVKYIEEINVIAKALDKYGRTYDILKGGSKDDIWYAFQDNPEPATLITQIQSGGTGIDLFAAHVGIFYSKSFSYIDFDQAKKRLNRRGQTKRVKLIHLLVENSIDVDIDAVVRKKGKKAQLVLTQLNKRRLSNGKNRKES